jgi:hypothetical protein
MALTLPLFQWNFASGIPDISKSPMQKTQIGIWRLASSSVSRRTMTLQLCALIDEATWSARRTGAAEINVNQDFLDGAR